jgi:hypothetical protein
MPPSLQEAQGEFTAIWIGLLTALCAEVLLYGVLLATFFQVIRALLFVGSQTFSNLWKAQWHFVIIACVMFLIATEDVIFTMWINFFAVVAGGDDPYALGHMEAFADKLDSVYDPVHVRQPNNLSTSRLLTVLHLQQIALVAQLMIGDGMLVRRRWSL